MATINSVCVKIGFAINGSSNMLFFSFWLFPFLFLFSKDYCQTTDLFNFFKICKEIHFISLFFLNERNITTSLLMAHSKCAIVHYANLNSSYINKRLLNYRPLKIPFLCFSSISCLRLFNEVFVKKNLKPVLLCPIKWPPLNVFVKLHKSLLLIANIVQDAISCLRQFLAIESP